VSAELGQTSDLTVLVPGNVNAIRQAEQTMRVYGDALHAAGNGLKAISTGEGWTGEAADRFRDLFHAQPGKWLDAGDCFHSAAAALDAYATTLDWARRQAADAIRLWNEGQALTAAAKAAHQQAVQQAEQYALAMLATGIVVAPPSIPFEDPGEAKRAAAQDILKRARVQLHSAGDTAADAVAQARDHAPEKPSIWSEVGDFLGDVGTGLLHAGEEAVNGLASLGNAVLHNPLDVVGTATGLALAAVGVGGEGLGLALDATGVGALVGVPAGALSATAIAAGATMMAASVGDLGRHAAGNDHVSPIDTSTHEQPPGVKPDWNSRVANNGKGTVYQRPGADGNNDMVRVMDPTNRYPNGYVRFYNEHGQPVGLDGKPGPPSATHIPRAADGSYPTPEGW
jgi:Putative T7SS secretion signal domain